MLTAQQRAQLRKMDAEEAIEAAYRMGRLDALGEAAITTRSTWRW